MIIPENVAYDDDDEHGVGYRLLELLKEHINNMMVIVIRWYGGTHTGSHRLTVSKSSKRGPSTTCQCHQVPEARRATPTSPDQKANTWV